MFGGSLTGLRRHLAINPVYPFTETEPGVYMLKRHSEAFLPSLVFAIVLLCTSTIIYSLITFNQYIVFPILAFVSASYTAWDQRHKRTLILNSGDKAYEFYIGDTLVHKGRYHNVYIRIKELVVGTDMVYYRLVVDGYEVEERIILRYTTNYRRLYALGRQLAKSLDLNYFDYEDRSVNHVIRHRRCYGSDQVCASQSADADEGETK